MNNEIAPILDILEELKQECKAISKAQAELRTTLTEQPTCTSTERTTTQETVQIHLSKETQAKIKEHQLFVLEALTQSSKKLDPKFEALQQLIREQQKPIEYKNYSLFASVQLADHMLVDWSWSAVGSLPWEPTNCKPPPITTSATATCVCKAKLQVKISPISTAFLSRIAIPKRFS